MPRLPAKRRIFQRTHFDPSKYTTMAKEQKYLRPTRVPTTTKKLTTPSPTWGVNASTNFWKCMFQNIYWRASRQAEEEVQRLNDKVTVEKLLFAGLSEKGKKKFLKANGNVNPEHIKNYRIKSFKMVLKQKK